MVITAFIDEARARNELIKLVYNGSVTCINCGRELDINKLIGGSFIKCSCGKKQNWKSGTIFQGSRLKAGELLMIKYFLDKNMEVKDIAAELNLTVDTVKLWKFKYENGV